MRHYELPEEADRSLISQEKAGSWKYKMVHLGVWIAVAGAVGFMLAFFYQNPINAAGVPYRQVQFVSILIVFAGWVIFNLFCASLGISTRKLSYNKLVAILKNRAEKPFDELRALRKQVALALTGLSDEQALFPAVFADDPARLVPAVLTGPGGIMALYPVYKNARGKDFVEPAPVLLAGSAELEKRLKQPVVPVVTFLRNKKGYEPKAENLKVFTLPELYAYIESRKQVLNPADLQLVEQEVRYLANIPRQQSEISNSAGKVNPAQVP